MLERAPLSLPLRLITDSHSESFLLLSVHFFFNFMWDFKGVLHSWVRLELVDPHLKSLVHFQLVVYRSWTVFFGKI